METTETQPQDEMWQQWEKEHKRGKVLGGMIIVIAGSLFLARELGVQFPSWLFTWKVVLIAIGLFSGIKHGFRTAGWLAPFAVGAIFLVSDLYPELILRPLIWPVVIIVFGLVMIFKPHRRNRPKFSNKWHMNRRYKREYYEKYNCYNTKEESSHEDSIDFVSCMGGIKKNILTKNFRNGEITVVFAGAKVDFSQADIGDNATLEVTAVFGGTQLVIPANWEIQSEMVCVFGNVEDKRALQPSIGEENKKSAGIKRHRILRRHRD